MKEAIAVAFPKTEYQRCIVHQVRNTLKYVPNKDGKVIYTTNTIESLNSTYRKLNRQRGVFPSDTALLKDMYLATFEATKSRRSPFGTGDRSTAN
jgi:transposase-like protein